MADARARPDHRRALDAQALGDLVGAEEADAADVGGQPVGVLADDGDGILAVGLEDPHGPAVPTPCECRKTIISRTLFCSRHASAIRAARVGPIPSTSRSRFGSRSITSKTFVPKASTRRLAKWPPIPLMRPDPRYFSIPAMVVGATDLQRAGAELQAVRAVVRPAALGLDELALGHGRGVTDDGGKVAAAANLDAEHAEPVLLVVEGDPFHGAGEMLHGRGRRVQELRLAHGRTLHRRRAGGAGGATGADGAGAGGAGGAVPKGPRAGSFHGPLDAAGRHGRDPFAAATPPDASQSRNGSRSLVRTGIRPAPRSNGFGPSRCPPGRGSAAPRSTAPRS